MHVYTNVAAQMKFLSTQHLPCSHIEKITFKITGTMCGHNHIVHLQVFLLKRKLLLFCRLYHYFGHRIPTVTS